ncbi:MAG: PIG-L family deacetylase [Desulfovibrio sp.]|nr:PIG-L family deacetylase [Desulfovibrio sp.]
MKAVFLFAHQDDEYGIFACLHDHCLQGDTVSCVYLTDGGSLAQIRKRETLAVLTDLGVRSWQVSFPGMDYGWHDGNLHRHYVDCCRWLVASLGSMAPQHVYVPAWEGGHPDHDTVHAAAVACAQHLNASFRLWQFPLYNGYGCSGPMFRTMLPLSANGSVLRHAISLRLRLYYTSLCLRYPSQWKSWLGLFLPVALRYVFGGKQLLQEVPLSQHGKPHAGRLYYERRGFCTWESLKAALQTNPFEVNHE